MKKSEHSLFVDMPSGVSGDMLLAALVGISGEKVLADLSNVLGDLLGNPIQVTLTKKKQCGLVCNQIHLPFEQDSDWTAVERIHSHGRYLSDIEKLLDNSQLDLSVINNSKKVFQLLGEAESYVHGVDIQSVHFHEVGALDSICDVVGFFWLVHQLDIKRIYCSFFTVGMGTVHCAHGEMPVPVPAVARLLEIFSPPVVRNQSRTGELTTPTGCAILLSCGIFENVPQTFRYKNSAFGLGQRIIPGKLNAVRISLVETSEEVIQQQKVVHIITNIDNDTPEVISNLCTKLLAMGALDVWQETIIMKKFRTGVQINILCDVVEKEKMMNTILVHSSSLGCRYQTMDRRILSRKNVSFPYEGVEIFAKIYRNVDGVNKVRVENDSIEEFCLRQNCPYIESLEILRGVAEELLRKGQLGKI